MTELSDSPPRNFYLAHVRVRWHELDPLGHTNNAVYLNFLEQAAIDHAAAAGYSSEVLQSRYGAVFIARRHEIDFLRPTYADDLLQITTWGAQMQGARALRRYEITRLPSNANHHLPSDRLIDPADRPPESGDLILRAQTLWAFANATTGRPQRIPPEVRSTFLTD